MLDRSHDPQPRLGVVTREDDDFNQTLALGEVVKVQEAPNKGESNSRF